MKTFVGKKSRSTGSRAASSQLRKSNRADSRLQRRLDEAATMQRQREQIEKSFGLPVQRRELEEEELLQGKFPSQLQHDLEEEELMQGRFEGPLQRRQDEEEELLQGKFGGQIQRREDEEEELLQGRFASPVQREQEAAPNQTGMPDGLKAGLESLSGHDLSEVRVHYDSPRPAQLNAHAFAQGNDIHLAPGQERHLPHEAWHTVQQRQGRVQPTMTLGGEQINDDAGLENEADIMGEKASRFGK